LTDPTNLFYTEFIAAAIEKRFFLSKDRLNLMFQYFDLDNKGAISCNNIKETFARCGNNITIENVKSMIKELEPDANVSEVSLDMFVNLMSVENFVKRNDDNQSEHSMGTNLGEGRGSRHHMQMLENLK